MEETKKKEVEIKTTTEDGSEMYDVDKGAKEVLIQTKIAESLFRHEGSYSGEDQLFFIQLPSQFPIKAPRTVATTSDQSSSSSSTSSIGSAQKGFKNNLSAIQGGKLGKLYILKSGTVKLKMGDVVYDVSQGMPCSFLQELVAIDRKTNKMVHLGNIEKRMVVAPDIQNIIGQ